MKRTIKEICEDNNIKFMNNKTDEEYESDYSKYEDNEVTRDIFEKDMLLNFEKLDFDTYYKLRKIELLKSINEKLDNLEMLYDVQRQLGTIVHKINEFNK